MLIRAVLTNIMHFDLHYAYSQATTANCTCAGEVPRETSAQAADKFIRL